MSELDQYDYQLPRDLIAQRPLAKRADARLLVVNRRKGSIEHAHVRDLPEILQPPDCLVLNDTRVVPARLVGHRDRTGGRWTGLFLRVDADGNWQLLGKTRGKLQPGETVTLQNRRALDAHRLRLVSKLPDGTWLARPAPNRDAFELLDEVGRVPLPPYIRGGEMETADRETYQTVFAEKPGAVAAPTAGLHFTEELLSRMRQVGIGVANVTLHVGLGTFKPVTAEQLGDHTMHAEWGRIDATNVQRLLECRQDGGRIVAVGTTAVRVLETAAANGPLRPWSGETTLFIRPPYEFRAVDALMTNFHLPRTTLLVLVSTFGGIDLIRRAYEEAIRAEYRFYSYGDAMLIL